MAENKNELITQPQTGIGKFAKAYTDLTMGMAVNNGLQFSESQKLAVMSASQLIFESCRTSKIDVNALDKSNVNKVLFNLAVLGLNPNANPRECYFTIRKEENKSTGKMDYTIELGIEGDGHDKLIRNHGIDVKSLSQPYIVREGDEFTFPYFDGEKMCPPTWKPKSMSAKPLYVFYILKHNDGTIDYPMADRDGVAMNLKAHINQNLMGVKDSIKNPILEKIDPMSLYDLLKDKELREVKCQVWNKYKKCYEEGTKTLISPSYASPHSRESMIIRKMRNNALSKVPKSMDNAFMKLAYNSVFQNDQENAVDPQDVLDSEFETTATTEKIESVIIDEDKGEVVENPSIIETTSKPQPTPDVEEPKDQNIPDWLKD